MTVNKCSCNVSSASRNDVQKDGLEIKDQCQKLVHGKDSQILQNDSKINFMNKVFQSFDITQENINRIFLLKGKFFQNC